MVKKILLVLLVVFVAIQFFRPARNVSNQVLASDITKVAPVPADVEQILQKACYDCHSNNTRYPWYANVQPTAWLLASHIREAKRELNFSEFGSYPERKQQKKLEEIVEQVQSGEMPLASYKLMHADARLSVEEQNSLISWAKSLAAEQSRTVASPVMDSTSR